jgi:cardiolipin synthase
VNPAWTSEKLFFSADAYFEDLLGAVAQARTSVRFESYIFADGRLATRVRTILMDAARRGVDVRLLVDGFGSPFWGGGDAEVLSATGVRCQVYWPAPWALWQWSFAEDYARSWWGPLRWLFRAFVHMNRRDHRKLCVVDDHAAWLGSMNVSDQHLSRLAGGDGWRDTGVRVEGPPVATLGALFDRCWDERKTPPPADFRRLKGPRSWALAVVRSNETRRRRRGFARDLVWRIGATRGRVWITNAYFVPALSLLRALQRAAKGGADVRVLLPEKSDIPMMGWVASSFYALLLKSGVRLFEYRAGVLHAKSVLLDRWAMVGSSNLNQRSLRHDLELDVALHKPASIDTLAARYLIDLERSHEIDPKTWEGSSRLRRALGWLFLALRSVL